VSRLPGWLTSATSAALATAGVVLLLLAAHAHQPPPRPAVAASGALELANPSASASANGADPSRPPLVPAAARPNNAVGERPVLPAARPRSAVEERPSASVRPGRLVAAAPLNPASPDRLQIPALGVSTTVVGLGLNADGSLQVPGNFSQAGWYRASPTPGALGPAVVMGHVDSAASGPAVFYRLAELRPGAGITIQRADGSTAVFTVTAVREYPKDHFPTGLVYANTSDAALRLITCGGGFDAASGHYRDNIVVFATLTGSQRA